MKIIKLFIYVTFVTSIFSCGKRSQQLLSLDADMYKSYIAAFPSDVISRSSTIRLILARELTAVPAMGEPFSSDIIVISPKVKGKT